MVHLNATTPQLKAVEQLADAIAARSLINAESTLAKDFIMRTFPKTAEFPDLSKEDYLQRYGLALPLFAKAEVTFHDVIEAPMKVVMHFTITFTTNDGTAVDHDSLMILSFVDEDGELKIIEAKDFSDPGKRGTFHGEIAKAMAVKGVVA